MAQFRTIAPAFSATGNPASFLECHVELLRSAVHNLKTDDTTKSVGTTWEGLGVFTPTFIALVATTITGLVAQPHITFRSVNNRSCTMTAAG